LLIDPVQSMMMHGIANPKISVMNIYFI